LEALALLAPIDTLRYTCRMNKIIDGFKTLFAGICTFGPIQTFRIMNQGGKRFDDFYKTYGRPPTKDEWAIISHYDARNNPQ
jgi:hypothetical protein